MGKHVPYLYGYMQDSLMPCKLSANLKLAVKLLKPFVNDFDSIAFTGISGAIHAPILAMRLKKELLLVRKSTDSTHDSREVNGFMGCRKYIIVDDFISTGKTIKKVQNKIAEAYPRARCIGTVEVHELKHQKPSASPITKKHLLRRKNVRSV